MFLPLVSLEPIRLEQSLPGFSKDTGRINHPTTNGRWIFQLFGDNVIKTTFHPAGYRKDEQLSNAVIQNHSQIISALHHDKKTPDFRKVARISKSEEKYSYQFDGHDSNVAVQYFAEHEYRGFKFNLQDGELIFGGGERALPLNRRGHGFSLNNSPAFGYGEGERNLNYSVPFIISSKGYGIFFDNPSRGYLDIGNKDNGILEAGFTSGELTFYIINGKNPDEILTRYSALVGRQPIPARWVFGNLMSRFGYRSRNQLMETVAAMKQENFPVDAVILDLFWFGDSIKNTMGNLEWVNSEKWPDPKGMISELKKAGINTVLIAEPYVLKASKNYNESKKFHALNQAGEPYVLKNFYFGEGGLLDMFRKDAQDWFWKKYKAQIDNGVAGWWGDLGEPETHPADMQHNLKDFGFSRLFASGEVHNIYAHYWNKMLFEKYQEDYPDTRLFNLNRSGYAGSQRYSVFPWSGDVGRNWSGFRAQMPVMLGMSISGVPYIHADAGGFAMGHKDPELYTRWLQFAAFTPVFRPHGTALEDLDTSVASIESEPVFYPDPYKTIVKKYIQLRYNLLPYNYTLAYQQARQGKPLTRPMFYDNTTDHDLLKAEDQYMWGDAILVAPVLQQGAVERTLFLPRGDWYDYLSNTKIRGGRWITEKVSIENIPLYVKAGAFIPTRPGLNNMEHYVSDSLQVTYYPDACDSSFTMYDDDGKTNLSFERGLYELLHFKAVVKEHSFSIHISSDGGLFKGRPDERTLDIRIPGLDRAPLSVKVNGVTTEEHLTIKYYACGCCVLSLAVRFSGTTQVIEVLK